MKQINLENISVFVMSFILGVVAAFAYESFSGYIGLTFFKRDALIMSGYKLHHSLYGILFLGIGYVNKNLFLAGFGVGIIIQHTFTDGFMFVQKM